MSDDSNRQDEKTTQAVVRQLSKHVTELMQLLDSQRQMLEQKGMTLPEGSLANLRSLKTRIEGLSRHMTNTFVELERLRALADTTALINSSLETDAVLNQVMDTVIQLTGAERGYIVLKDRTTGAFDQFRVARGLDVNEPDPPGSDENQTKKSEFIVSKTIVNEVAQTGEAVLADNASQDDRYRGQQSIVGFALRSILAVPLKVREEVIGVVYCDNRILAGLFQESDLAILKAFSNQAAVAIENARLFEQARQQLQQITEIRDLMDNVFYSIANGVITIDTRSMVTTCNDAAHQILDLPDDVETVGAPLSDLLPAMDDVFSTTIDQVRQDGAQRMIEVQPVLHGQPRIWNIIVSSLRDADGVSQGVAFVFDDLTDKRKREEQLTELRRYLPGALVDNLGSVDDINVRGQERVITVIATDVRGFTTFSERLEPEQLMEVINQYLSLASDGINLYEGIVDKYMGDAVTGLFNTQLNPQEDHAIRAVRAAMTIIYDLYALHEVMSDDQRLYYGIGIHTGPAYLGNVGSPDRQEFSAMGEAATIAKILESTARAGEVIISQATYDIVGDYFECEARTLENTRGYDALKTIYKVNKRKKGVNTGQLFLDPELAELLADINRDTDV